MRDKDVKPGKSYLYGRRSVVVQHRCPCGGAGDDGCRRWILDQDGPGVLAQDLEPLTAAPLTVATGNQVGDVMLAPDGKAFRLRRLYTNEDGVDDWRVDCLMYADGSVCRDIDIAAPADAVEWNRTERPHLAVGQRWWYCGEIRTIEMNMSSASGMNVPVGFCWCDGAGVYHEVDPLEHLHSVYVGMMPPTLHRTETQGAHGDRSATPRPRWFMMVIAGTMPVAWDASDMGARGYLTGRGCPADFLDRAEIGDFYTDRSQLMVVRLGASFRE